MGKFDGVLIASDFDNTLVYTEGYMSGGAAVPLLAQENREAIEYFMAQGGIFSVATGRALPAFDAVRACVPMNGPTVIFNGAAIYDYSRGIYLYASFLSESVRPHVTQVLEAFPEAACEIYHDDSSVQVLQANEFSRRHALLTMAPAQPATSMDDVPLPISKALFEADASDMPRLSAYVRSRPWSGQYEIIPSSSHLLELTARGAHKGGMVRKLAELLHILPENLYCVGDQSNDIPMLEISRIPYAPANAAAGVLSVADLHILPDCRDGAIAAMIRELDGLY